MTTGLFSQIAAKNDAEREKIHKRRKDVVVGAVDALGYVVCSACVAAGRATGNLKPIVYGTTYSTESCERCGARVDGEK